MSNKPYASDWEEIGNGVQYSAELKRWFKDDTTYDERSAIHNGIIGAGAELRNILKQTNTFFS